MKEDVEKNDEPQIKENFWSNAFNFNLIGIFLVWMVLAFTFACIVPSSSNIVNRQRVINFYLFFALVTILLLIWRYFTTPKNERRC